MSRPPQQQQQRPVNMFKQMEKGSAASVAQKQGSTIKEALLRWCQNKVRDYPITIDNFSSSWANGLAFCALIHHFFPDAFDFSQLNANDRARNLHLAFTTAEQRAGIMPLLEVDDMLMMGDRPDWKCIFTYVQTFYTRFRDAE